VKRKGKASSQKATFEEVKMPDKPEQQTAKLEQQTGKATSLNIRLTSRDHADQPVLANYSAVNVAQGLAYLDFGFIEPTALGAVMRAAKANGPLPKALEGRLASRIALPLDALLRLHQQLQQVLQGLRGAKVEKNESQPKLRATHSGDGGRRLEATE
jgi:hypothetical protein